MSDERAVSEVLGYVLVIALITMTIAVVMTTGIGGLESSQQSEQINNMERGFDVLSHNIETLTGGDAPTRATELRLVEGKITYGEEMTVNVTHDGNLIDNLSIISRPIVYDSGSDVEIVYEAGALIRSDGGVSTILSEPSIVESNDSLLVEGVRTRAYTGSEETIDEVDTTHVRKEHLGTPTATKIINEGEIVNVTVSSSHADAWMTYFEDGDGTVEQVNDKLVRYQIVAEEELQVIVTQPRIRVTLAR